MRVNATLFLPLILLAACTATPTTRTGAAPVATSRCSPASADLVNRVSAGLIGGVTLDHVFTVKSNDRQNTWFIAGQIHGAGIPAGTVALWASNGDGASGMTFGIDGFAHQFSNWADGTKTDVKLSAQDDGAREALKCAR